MRPRPANVEAPILIDPDLDPGLERQRAAGADGDTSEQDVWEAGVRPEYLTFQSLTAQDNGVTTVAAAAGTVVFVGVITAVAVAVRVCVAD